MDALFFTETERREWGEHFKRLFPEKARDALNEADRLCEMNSFYWKDDKIDMGDPIDWLHNPTGDKEFTWTVNRFKHLRPLGIAYAATGDEKYAAKALDHIMGWIETQPCPRHLPPEEIVYFQRPGPWRLLETGLRLRQWVYAYHFFHGSASWTAEKERRFFESVREHAWFLSAYQASIEINHSIMHMIGLLSAALTFSSWKESCEWRAAACERLEECIRVQVLEDGVHTELTPHYHMVSLELFVDCAVMMRKRGLRFSAAYEETLSGMVKFSRCMTRQDGRMAPFSDSYASHPPDLNAAALYFDRPEWALREELHEQFWTVGPDRITAMLEATDAGGSPSPASVRLPFAFPSAGYYGMGSEEQKMIFDAAALGGPHGHADALSFEWFAFGEALFVDPGIYTYMETPWRRYFKSTAAHNTVLVDGQDQTPYLRTQRWGEPEANVRLLAWDPDRQMICAEHDGYSLRGITHRRAVWFLETGEWVVYDRLWGKGSHTYQHRLHSRLLEWDIRRIAAGEYCKFYAAGGGLNGNCAASSEPNGNSAAGGDLNGDYAVRGELIGNSVAGGDLNGDYAVRGELIENNAAGGDLNGDYAVRGRSNDDAAFGCDMLLFGPETMEVDVEDGWESVRPMSTEPLKVVQGLVTSEVPAWFITVFKPNRGTSALTPAEWTVSLDESGNPVLHFASAEEEKRFQIPDSYIPGASFG